MYEICGLFFWGGGMLGGVTFQALLHEPKTQNLHMHLHPVDNQVFTGLVCDWGGGAPFLLLGGYIALCPHVSYPLISNKQLKL